MSLARRFNAGIRWLAGSRRVATIEIALIFRRRYATLRLCPPFPALKGRAKFIPTLRVESTYSEVPKVYATL
jgi:hypothetical protein